MAGSAKVILLKDRKEVGPYGSPPHCEYCEAPDRFVLETYDGDTCQIYHDYSEVRGSFGSTSFTLQELTKNCRDSFLGKYPDVQDFDKTIQEMLVDIDFNDLGIVCKVDDNLFRAV